jgi:hypothetical protein
MPVAITTAWLGVAIVTGTIAATLVGVVLVRRFVPRGRIAENHDVAAVMFSMVGVLYAILLAFVVVVVWEEFGAADRSVNDEVTKISNLMRDANAFDPARRSEIQTRLIDYARSVVNDEWKTMAHGERSPEAAEKYRRIWSAYYGYTPRTEIQHSFYDESINKLNELGAARRLRLLASESSVPRILWMLLIAGAIITLGFVYLFEMPGRFVQPLVAGALAGLTGFILFLVLALDHPFAGQVKIAPTAFVQVVDGYEHGDYCAAAVRTSCTR